MKTKLGFRCVGDEADYSIMTADAVGTDTATELMVPVRKGGVKRMAWRNGLVRWIVRAPWMTVWEWRGGEEGQRQTKSVAVEELKRTEGKRDGGGQVVEGEVRTGGGNGGVTQASESET